VRKSGSQTQLLSPDRLVPNSAERPEILESTRSLLEQTFHTAEQKAEGLSKLAEAVSVCKRCAELADTRRQTVFGVGNPDAEIMFIGEAPGADEDRQGEPFVGAAGKLMDRIIAACGLKREEIYICNILRCRPPGNRNPHPQEAANCREFLDAQIKIVAPKYIIAWGTVAAQNLLGETRPVGRLRGKFLQHGDARVMCTYHPSYLLRNESAKKLVWEDMKFFMKELGTDLG
jgi:DNA polymerase